jgi:hypothetical protein
MALEAGHLASNGQKSPSSRFWQQSSSTVDASGLKRLKGLDKYDNHCVSL